MWGREITENIEAFFKKLLAGKVGNKEESLANFSCKRGVPSLLRKAREWYVTDNL